MMSLRRPTLPALACIAGLLAGGCGTGTPVAPYAQAVQALWTSDQAALPSQLNPAYRYLKIQAGNAAPALLVLGYEDPHPDGKIEVWYSARQEVVKLQNGRIIGTAGLPVNWHQVRFRAPDWSAVPATGIHYQRLRDASPGYRANLADQVTLKPQTGQPDLVLPADLSGAIADRLSWFREDVTSSEALPTAWFAWGRYRGQNDIVYARQCLSPEYCLQLQRWPQDAF